MRLPTTIIRVRQWGEDFMVRVFRIEGLGFRGLGVERVVQDFLHSQSGWSFGVRA